MVKESDPWLEASDVIPMFPTLMWKVLLKAELRDAIDAKVLATIERLRRDLPTLKPGHGWQSEQTLHGSGASTDERAEATDFRPANRFSCNGTLPVGPERSVVTRMASSEGKLMLMDAMSEFYASNRDGRIGERLEAFH